MTTAAERMTELKALESRLIAREVQLRTERDAVLAELDKVIAELDTIAYPDYFKQRITEMMPPGDGAVAVTYWKHGLAIRRFDPATRDHTATALGRYLNDLRVEGSDITFDGTRAINSHTDESWTIESASEVQTS